MSKSCHEIRRNGKNEKYKNYVDQQFTSGFLQNIYPIPLDINTDIERNS